MADGSGSFNFPLPQQSRLRAGEIIVDLFAGGGGASEALRQALGRDPDLAINHDALAIGMHAANHPLARHLREDVWQADPVVETRGQPVGRVKPGPRMAPIASTGPAETVEQFIARGGRIQQLPGIRNRPLYALKEPQP